MLTEEQLVSLITDMEADNIERTESVSKIDKLVSHLCLCQ